MSKISNLLDLCDEIRSSQLPASEQYDLIFSDKISRVIFDEFNIKGASLDYYDPDTSYEEDMDAFINAAKRQYKEYIVEQKENLPEDSDELKNHFYRKASKIR